jgi:hypothetical protein
MKLLLAFLVFCAVTVNAQQHAPTKVQCDADLNLWRSGLITGTYGENALRDDAKIGFMELTIEAQEMALCEGAYMPGETLGSGPYAELGKVFDSIIETRLLDFMSRHPDVFAQFAKEDAAGVRGKDR